MVKAWHFLPPDGRIAHRNRRKVEVRQTYSCKGPLVLCRNGMHGSLRIMDALKYAPGPILCRTEHSGEIVYGNDKLCSRSRKVLAMADVTMVLHEFACRVAESTLKKVGVMDDRSWAAIETKRRWMTGKASAEELAVARAAAWAAAYTIANAAANTVAWDAAWDTANDAVCAVATDAARAAVRAIANDAASAAVWYAASDEAWYAANDATWYATCAAATDEMESVLIDLITEVQEW